jgi:hypothetical protein
VGTEATGRKRPRGDDRDDEVSCCTGTLLTLQRPIRLIVTDNKHDGNDGGSAGDDS